MSESRKFKIFGTTLGLLAGLTLLSPSFVEAQGVSSKSEPASSTKNLWIKFSHPQSLVVVDGRANGSDLLPESTLQGAYNQQQRSSRIFLVQGADDLSWLKDGVPAITKVTHLPASTSSPNGTLEAMLTRFGPFIKGAIITDPANPETINLATTEAGIDDAMVITPSEESFVEKYHIKVLDDFRHYHLTGIIPTYQWAIQHLLPKTNQKMLLMLVPTIQGDIRDYAVATKSFVFNLTATNFDQQLNLMVKIFKHTPKNTPIFGYIQNEGVDVPTLSALGHFLNASDFLTNESVWAAMPSPSHFTQPTPKAVKANPGTAYVSFMVSDGDNSQYVEHRMYSDWHQPAFGTVPLGWTLPPGMIEFAPTLMRWYYQHLPKNSELIAGPSGVGYATDESGSNLQQLARLSAEYTNRDDMHVVDYWGSEDALKPYAESSKVLDISYQNPSPYQLVGNTVIFGQTSGYIGSSHQLIQSIEQQVASAPKGKPIFLQPLIDAWNLSPSDIHHVALQLASSGTASYVFLTPSEFALTMRDYYLHEEKGLPASNTQAIPGSKLS